MTDNPRPGQPQPPRPAPPPFDEPKPVRDPEPDRLPDEAPVPNPDETDAPPLHAAAAPDRGRTANDKTRNEETSPLTEPEPLPPRKARQGRKGLPILFVLVGGLLLAMIVWWLVEIYGGAIAPENAVGDPATVPLEELQTEPAN